MKGKKICLILTYFALTSLNLNGAVIKENNDNGVLDSFKKQIDSAINTTQLKFLSNYSSILSDNKDFISLVDLSSLRLEALCFALNLIDHHIENIYTMHEELELKVISEKTAKDMFSYITQKLNNILPVIITKDIDLLLNFISFTRKYYIYSTEEYFSKDIITTAKSVNIIPKKYFNLAPIHLSKDISGPNKSINLYFPKEKFYQINYFIFKLGIDAGLLNDNIDAVCNIALRFPSQIIDPENFLNSDANVNLNNLLRTKIIPHIDKKKLYKIIDIIIKNKFININEYFNKISIDNDILEPLKLNIPNSKPENFFTTNLYYSIFSDYLLENNKFIDLSKIKACIKLDPHKPYLYYPYASSGYKYATLDAIYKDRIIALIKHFSLTRFFSLIDLVLNIQENIIHPCSDLALDLQKAEYEKTDALIKIEKLGEFNAIFLNDNSKPSEEQKLIIYSILNKNYLLLRYMANKVDLNFKIKKINKPFNWERSFEGYTPLLLATISRDPILTSILLENGAKTSIKNNNDRSALMIANISRPFDDLSIIFLAHYTDDKAILEEVIEHLKKTRLSPYSSEYIDKYIKYFYESEIEFLEKKLNNYKV